MRRSFPRSAAIAAITSHFGVRSNGPKKSRLWAAAALASAGCGTEATSSDFIDLHVPTAAVPAGAERLFCYYLDNPAGDVAIDYSLGEQAPGGHHLALKGGGVRRANGTFEDCTATQNSLGLHDIHFGGNLPPDGAIRLHAGQQLVVQSHYINASDSPVEVNDVLRLHRATVTDTTRWMSALHLADDNVVVAPGDYTRTFSCAPTADTSLVMLWGHMHGMGKQFTIADGASIIYREDWQPAFAADPPRLVADTAPVVFHADAPLAVSCEWMNTTGAPLAYPAEMCGVGGYVLGDTPFWCGGDSD